LLAWIHSEDDARKAFDLFSQRLVFFGHTHLSQVHELRPDGQLRFYRSTPEVAEFTLSLTSRYLVNVGAAPDCTVVYDSERGHLRFQFVQGLQIRANSPHRPLWRRFCDSLRKRLSLP
jgi:hypothetical protein